MTVFNDMEIEDVKKLLHKGFVEEEVKTLYEQMRLKKGNVVLIFYNSKKLLLQGKKEEVEEAVNLIKKMGAKEEKKESFRKETGWIIGTDESLKGDTFGGLVVAGVKANEELRKKLNEIGVADSKTLSDREILLMAEKIKQLVPCEVKSLLPEEYNKNGEITLMLNKLHKECADYLFPGKHIVDKYPGCKVGDVQEEKADSKYVEVAAASVLARATALKQLDFLSVQVGFKLPKGSTHVRPALKELKEKKLNFKRFVKVDFNNVKEFL
ncbi:MAG: hypothetical protein KKA62_06090 [Nanoarchaeota archaeon]|nr:hypothetical protein [Nanoarchaeota archaeon]MBU1644421.1 hypothetical protein [Nanoarchaeota archaeon]MBU1977495.1 hypothetical protein [Nanoarchaeota archaeon]